MKKNFKKWLCVVLAVALLASTLPLIAGALAPSGGSTDSAQSSGQAPLKVEIKSNKDKYTLLGKMEFTATITNTSSSTVENISAQALLGSSLRPLKNGSQFAVTKDSLAPGASFSFTYYADLNGLKSLDNLLLPFFWISSLFHGGKADIGNGNGGADYIEASKAVRLVSLFSGQYDASTRVRVWFGENEFHRQVREQLKLDAELKILTSSNNYLALSEAEKKNTMEAILIRYAEEGTIQKDSIRYNASTKSFEYTYTTGGLAGWGVVKDPHGHSKKSSENSSVNSNERLSSQSLSSQSALNAVIMFAYYLWSPDDDAVWAHNRMYELSNELESSGVSTTLFTSPTVEDFKTALQRKDLIIIAVHGNRRTIDGVDYSTLCLLEDATEEKIEEKYKADIDEKRILVKEGKFEILPKFFSDYYKNNLLDNSMVFLWSCCSFGLGELLDYKLARSFEGTATVVGFKNPASMDYAFDFLDTLVNNLLDKKTTGEAFDSAEDLWGANDVIYSIRYPISYTPDTTNPGTPYMEGKTDKKLINTNTFATITGTVVEQGTNAPLPGVLVQATKTGSTAVEDLATTSASGGFILMVEPNTTYNLKFTKAGYEEKMLSNVSIGSALALGDVAMALSTNIFATITGTVIEQGTNAPLSGVLVQATKTGSTTVEDLATTSASGGFILMVEPNTTYNLKFTKAGYQEQSLTNVNVGSALALGDVVIVSSGSSGFAGGTGTEQDPYLIATPAQLNNVRNDFTAHYKLINDIDLAEWGNWEPIVSFGGVFDGDGYTIRNMTVNESSYQYAGLFGYVGGTYIYAYIRNVGVVNSIVNITGRTAYAGGIAGYVLNGSIDNCYYTGEVKANTANGPAFAGGIVGSGDLSRTGVWISNSYNTGTVSAISASSNAWAGGIIGSTSKYITNCYNIGRVNATSNVIAGSGGISGGYCLDIINSYYINNIGNAVGNGTGDVTFTNVLALTETQMKQQASFVGFDFSTVWAISPTINNGYPYLRGMQP